MARKFKLNYFFFSKLNLNFCAKNVGKTRFARFVTKKWFFFLEFNTLWTHYCLIAKNEHCPFLHRLWQKGQKEMWLPFCPLWLWPMKWVIWLFEGMHIYLSSTMNSRIDIDSIGTEPHFRNLPNSQTHAGRLLRFDNTAFQSVSP